MNKKIILFLIFGFIFGLVGAQWDERPIVNIGELIGSGVIIQGQGIDYLYDESNTVKISSDNSILQVGDRFFENLNEGSFFEFDFEGNILNADFTTNEEGGLYFLGGVEFEVPPNTKVTYSKSMEEIRLRALGEMKFNKMPLFEEHSSSSFILDSGEGKWELAPRHFLEEGELEVSGEGFYSKAGSKINGVLFGKYSSGVSVSFDGETFGEKFLLFEDNSLKGSGGFGLDFTKENPYTKIEEGDFFQINLEGGSFELNSNLRENKIPDLKLKGNSRISENSMSLSFLDGEVFVSGIGRKFTTTTPLKISFLNDDGSPSLGVFDSGFRENFEGEEYQILVDNFNRFAVVSVHAGDEFFSKSEGIDTKFSSKLSYNYLEEEDMFVLVGDRINNPQKSFYKDLLDVSLDKGTESFYYGRLRDYWETLPEETKKSFSQIYILGEDMIPDVGGKACYNPGDNSVYFQADFFRLDVFRHELAHAQHYSSSNPLFPEKSLDFFNSEDRVESLFLEREEKTLKGSLSDDFRNLYSSKRLEYDESRSSPKDYSHGSPPSKGFFSNYGKKNVFEDVAVTVEKVVANPEIFKDLINPESPNYDKEYGPIYRGKLKAVYEYGLITEEEYLRVLDMAGVKK